MSSLCEHLGKKVREYRKAKQYSTVDLAQRLNVSVGLINNIENARNDVFKLELLKKIVHELGVSFEELLKLNFVDITELEITNEGKKIAIKSSRDLPNEMIETVNNNLNDILRIFLSIASQYLNNPEMITELSIHLKQQLEFLNKLITNNRTTTPNC